MVQPAEEWGAKSDFYGPPTVEEADREIQEMKERQAACRRQFGLSLRKAVSKLPRLTLLRLSHVNFEEPSPDIVALHPYSQLR